MTGKRLVVSVTYLDENRNVDLRWFVPVMTEILDSCCRTFMWSMILQQLAVMHCLSQNIHLLISHHLHFVLAHELAERGLLRDVYLASGIHFLHVCRPSVFHLAI